MATEYFRLEAPYPAIASTVLLPRPRIGNNLGLRSDVRVITMMDGSRRSFIRRGAGKKTHRWTFRITSDKMEEFMDFIERYRAEKFRATWRGRSIVGQITGNPVEPVGAGRAGGQPGGEVYNVTIEMVEV